MANFTAAAAAAQWNIHLQFVDYFANLQFFQFFPFYYSKNEEFSLGTAPRPTAAAYAPGFCFRPFFRFAYWLQDGKCILGKLRKKPAIF